MPVPQERDFLGSLNVIKTLIESTCEDKWGILIETALPAAGEALWLLLVPDPEQIVQNYLHPRTERGDKKRAKGGYGRRRTTRYGQRRWWQKIGFPDVDAMVAATIPGAEIHKGRTAGSKEKWLWTSIDILDRLGWYYLLIDITHDFAIQWSSGIIESRFCTTPLNALFIATGVDTIHDDSGPFWSNKENVQVATNKGWLVSDHGEITYSNPFVGVSGAVIAELTATRPEGGSQRPSTTEIIMHVHRVSEPTTIILSDAKKIDPGETFTLTAAGPISDAKNIDVNLRLVGSSFVVGLENVHWSLQAWATPDT